jgi:hypothetical protein
MVAWGRVHSCCRNRPDSKIQPTTTKTGDFNPQRGQWLHWSIPTGQEPVAGERVVGELAHPLRSGLRPVGLEGVHHGSLVMVR